MTMVRLAIFLLGSLWAASAFAQAQPPQPPGAPQSSANPQETIERTIGSLFVTNTNLSAQLTAAQQQIADLKRQLEEAKKDKPKSDK